ncbi:SNF2-related protein [Cetobacterium ceti]
MAFFDILSKIFKDNNKDNEFKFRKKYTKEYIEIEIFILNKKINLEDFSQKEYEYLLKTDIFKIDIEKNILKLPYENIYILDKESIDFFGLPDYFLGTLKIENNTNFLNNLGVKFNVEFTDGENEYLYQYKNLVTRNKDGKRFFLKKKDFQLITEIYAYNSDSEKNIISTEQYKIAKKVKKLKNEKEILVGNDIEKIGDIEIIDFLELDFQEKNENDMEVVPILKNIDSPIKTEKIIEEFKKEFKKTKGLKKIYTLKIDGIDHEVILNKNLLKALEVVKENNDTISKKDFIKKDNPIFFDERMNIENLDYNYGPRVKGLGFLNYRATPSMNNSDIEWFSFDLPYIDTLDGEQIKLRPKDVEYLEQKSKEVLDLDDEVLVDFDTEEGSKKLFLKKRNIQDEILKIKNSCKEIIDLKKTEDMKNILELMKENDDEEYVEYKGYYIKSVKDREYIEELIKEKEREEELNEKNKNKNKVLILKDNIEALEHVEKNIASKKKFNYEEPKSLNKNIKLLPYQRDGVGIMEGLYKSNKINGILLADDMGLGKTLQILVFLAWIKEENKDFKGIILVPTSLITNWIGEIQKFFVENTFKIQLLKGKLIKSQLEEIMGCNLLITSYETLRINHIELGKIEWDVMVCDEAQKIKNPSTLLTTAVKAQNVKFKIACSATPIENTILDLWCLVDFSNPGLLGSLKEFKKKYLIKESDPEKLKKINDELKYKLGDNFLRRTKDVLNCQGKEFPKKIVIYNHLKCSEAQRTILDTFNQMKLNGESTLPLIQGMIMACSHPRLIEKNNELEVENKQLEKESFKLGTVKDILKGIKDKDEKVIIFTKYRKMQKILSVLIKDWYGFNPSIINGDFSTEIRKEILDKYIKSDGFNVIILSPEAAGVGLNIVEANHVIHYTRHWNPAKEEQATDRAYRIGQKKDVYVYYPLVASDETYGELKFNTVNDWIESKEFNFTQKNSPEEKLNKIILKKKKQLRDFFLAAPIDVNITDFDDFKDRDIHKDSIMNIEHLDLLEWEYLEAASVVLLEKKYGRKGYLTKKTGDFGVDGLIEISKDDFLAIQVKKSKNTVGKIALEEVLSGKKIYEKSLKKKIKKIAVITNSKVTETLKEWESDNIEIIDRKKLSNLLQKYIITFEEIQKKLYESYKK